jgi:uncharacterized protein YigE (DUF2233 family)
MKNSKRYITLFAIILTVLFFSFQQHTDERFVSYTTSPENIIMHWKDDSGKRLGSLKAFRQFIEGKGQKLDFAMNGGMYQPGRSPLGLYIENRTMLSPVDTSNGKGNFYMKPNGVFYIDTNNKAVIVPTDVFKSNSTIKFATQSGPMLVIDGKIHPSFVEGSDNTNIRNGVGILPDGKVVMAMSKEKINFYDFASYFKKLGCKNALYLDGLVSRTYCPSQNWTQTDGNFGVIIGVVSQ